MPLGGALTVGSAVLSTAKSGFQLGNSLHKLKQDKEELAKLKPAYYKIQDEYYQNRNLANQQAQGGLGAATKDYYTNESERGLGAGISGILGSGGNPNDISHLFDSYDKSIDRVASADAEAHLKNIDYFMNVNKDLAGQKTTQWGVNEYKPYQDKLSELTNRRAADEKSAWNGASGIIGGIGAAGTSLQNADLLKSLTKGGGGAAGLIAKVSGGFGDPNKIPSAIDEPFNPRSMSAEMQKFYYDDLNSSSGDNNTAPPRNSGNPTQLFQQFQQWMESQRQNGKI